MPTTPQAERGKGSTVAMTPYVEGIIGAMGWEVLLNCH